MTDNIDLFLEKVRLTEYRECFGKEDVCHVSEVFEFRRFLTNQDYLKQIVGMSSLEVKRFVRLCETTLQEIKSKHVAVELVQKSKTSPPLLTMEPLIPLTRQIVVSMYKKKIYCKFLNKEGVFFDNAYPIEVDQSIRYYMFVGLVHRVVFKKVKYMNFKSVELYSETGYPLASTPSIYIQPLSNWGLRDNELIYAYPKKLHTLKYKNIADVDSKKIVINIRLKSTEISKQYTLHEEKNVMILELKNKICLNFHIQIECITILQYDRLGLEKILFDNLGNNELLLYENELFFTISDTYGNNDHFNAFHSVYTSCYPFNIRSDFEKFNAYLLYLVREYGEKRDRDRLLRRLGLLRKISCSPPLVYSLYLLFTQSPTSLPHRIAINEGIITTISLLSTSSDRPTISKFPQLWMHIEEHALTPDLQLTEIYETTFISKRTRENPRDDDTRRLLQAFPPNQDTIVTWRNASSTHDAFIYTPPTRLEDFTEGVKRRFPLQHPVQLYKSFVEERKSYGLMLPLIRGLSSPCVFLGRTEGRYGYFNYFSPENGRCYSFNPHDINISERLEISNINSYHKIIIILDISRDMNMLYLDYFKMSGAINIGLSQRDAAIMLLESLVNSLIGSECRYLLGALLISNDHDFADGFFEIIPPTFKYCIVSEKIRRFVETFSPKLSTVKSRPNQGIIINVLDYCIQIYCSSHSREFKTKIFLFTNGDHTKKYYGSKKDSFVQGLNNSACAINTVMMCQRDAVELEKLFKTTKGIHVNYKFFKYKSGEISFNRQTHPFLDYSSILQDILSAGIGHSSFESYHSVEKNLVNKLINTEEFLNNSERDKESYQKAMIVKGAIPLCVCILRKVTAYTKSPNPYCKLYPFNDDILNWIIMMQGPIHSPFENSIFILELYFGEQYPHYPPKLRFLSSVYHPNVDKAGHICHPILIEDYSPSVSLRQILDSIHSMLARPIISHAVRSKVLEIAMWCNELYDKAGNSLCEILSLKGKTLFTIERDFKIKSDYSNVSHPPALVCSITNQLFDNPVMTPEGNTYERHAILQHIENTHTDPISSTPLRSSDLIPNLAIADGVLKYKRKLLTRSYWWEL